MVGRRFSGRTALAVAVLLVLAVLPAGAADGDRALALHALADHEESYLLRINNGHPIVGMGKGGHAEVVMPPQTDAVETGQPPATIYALGRFAGHRGEVTNRAAGSLAEGVASASSHTEHLYLAIDGVEIAARSLRSVSTSACDGDQTPAAASAGSAISSLRVDGETITVGDEPNATTHRADLPDGRGYVEIAPLVVEPADDGLGWSTTALRIRVVTTTPNPPPITSPTSTVTHELAYGIATTSIDCAT